MTARQGTASEQADEVPELLVSTVLTCTNCSQTYELTAGDFATGRTECPDPDCLGWTFWAQLHDLGDEGAATPRPRPDGGCWR